MLSEVCWQTEVKLSCRGRRQASDKRKKKNSSHEGDRKERELTLEADRPAFEPWSGLCVPAEETAG